MSAIIKDASVSRISATRIDDLLWLGDAEDHRQAKKKGFEAILNVAQAVEYTPPAGVEYRKIPLTDDGNNSAQLVMEAVDTLAEFIAQGKRTLVHCRAGVSRSASIVALYYHLYHDWPLHGALEAIQDKRPIVNPTEGMWLTTVLCSKGVRNG